MMALYPAAAVRVLFSVAEHRLSRIEEFVGSPYRHLIRIAGEIAQLLPAATFCRPRHPVARQSWRLLAREVWLGTVILAAKHLYTSLPRVSCLHPLNWDIVPRAIKESAAALRRSPPPAG